MLTYYPDKCKHFLLFLTNKVPHANIIKKETGVIHMNVLQLDHRKVLEFFPLRPNDAHKGNFGKDLLLCGSRGYTGAAALAAMGALRVGAGLVYLAVPESIYTIEAVKLTEPIVYPLPDEMGMYAPEAIHQIRQLMQGKHAVLVGPGIGQSGGTLAVVSTVLKEFPGPVILDADGINVIREHMDILRERTYPTILTPHDGEFLRIGGQLSEDRMEAAAVLAADLGVIVLLKGHRTVITDGKTCYLNTTGNPGMATGGSGDVLAGMITGLIGQGIPPLEASACAAWLHGAAGDLCQNQLGQYSMLPSDMLNVLPRLFKRDGII